MSRTSEATTPGLCQCGCGGKTNIATCTEYRKGWIKGQPVAFIHGHNKAAYRPTLERFWEKVNKDGPVSPFRPDLGPCWIWLGCIHKTGYGIFWNRRHISAHRFSLELALGRSLEYLDADHLCRVRACVNPSHLEPVTNRENVLRGNGPTAINARKNECPKGHPLVAGNLKKDKRGGRSCRICHNTAARLRRYKAKLVEASL